ncbi:hypothetical protein M0805_008898 [Coniferiporia weirii]|nr:hypothetical protein M0805_008898 [Coniferiporia weirii]
MISLRSLIIPDALKVLSCARRKRVSALPGQIRGTHDLVPVRFIYLDRVGGTYSVKYNPKLQWHYLSDQRPDGVTLIKCFDSDERKARLTSHTAFADTSSPESAPKRQSIEVRTLVFDLE